MIQILILAVDCQLDERCRTGQIGLIMAELIMATGMDQPSAEYLDALLIEQVEDYQCFNTAK